MKNLQLKDTYSITRTLVNREDPHYTRTLSVCEDVDWSCVTEEHKRVRLIVPVDGGVPVLMLSTGVFSTS